MDERLRDINSKETKDLRLYAIAIYHHEGPLETRVRSKLDAWDANALLQNTAYIVRNSVS